MEGKIKGSWPGGPRREGPPQDRSGPPRLERVEQIEERVAGGSARRKRKRRLKHLLGVFAFAAVVAGGVGWVMGLRSHTTADAIMAEQQDALRQQQEQDLMSMEINRVMMELWRMEDVEYGRNSRGR